MFPSIFVFISDSLDAINCMMLVIRSNASDLSAATLSRLAGIFLSLARQLLMMFHQVRVDGLPFSLLYPSLSHAPSYKRITSALWTVLMTFGIEIFLFEDNLTVRVPLAAFWTKPLNCMKSRNWLICSSVTLTWKYLPGSVGTPLNPILACLLPLLIWCLVVPGNISNICAIVNSYVPSLFTHKIDSCCTLVLTLEADETAFWWALVTSESNDDGSVIDFLSWLTCPGAMFSSTLSTATRLFHINFLCLLSESIKIGTKLVFYWCPITLYTTHRLVERIFPIFITKMVIWG